MFIKQMTNSTGSDHHLLNNPTWEDVKREIHRLDGHRNTEIILGPGGEQPYMLISGGNEKQYICIVTYDNETFFNLKNLGNSAEDEIWLVCGGQGADFPAQQVVDLSKVLKAARVFAEHGELDGSLVWSTQ